MTIVTEKPIMDFESFLEKRKQGIGGSDVPALFGKSPWKSAHQVYMSKVGLDEGERPAIQVHQELGLVKEPGLIEMYLRRRSGVTVLSSPIMRVHPVYPFMIGNLDGLILGRDGNPVGVLEIKTAGWGKSWQWGHESTDEVPEDYNLQVHHYMAVTGLPYADIAVEIGGSDFRIYRVERNEELINIIVARCKDFWENYVVPMIPPPIDGSEGAAKMLRALYPNSEDEELLANPEIDAICKSMFEAIDRANDADAAVTALKNQVMEVMKEKGILSGPGYRVTWKTAKDREKTDYKAVCEEVKAPAELIAKHTTTSPGVRSFRPGKLKKEE